MSCWWSRDALVDVVDPNNINSTREPVQIAIRATRSFIKHSANSTTAHNDDDAILLT